MRFVTRIQGERATEFGEAAAVGKAGAWPAQAGAASSEMGTRQIPAGPTRYGDLRTTRIRVEIGGLFFPHHQSIGHRYYLGMHMILVAPVDAVTEIRVAKKTVWQGEVGASSRITIDKADILGGDRKGGAASRAMSTSSSARRISRKTTTSRRICPV